MHLTSAAQVDMGREQSSDSLWGLGTAVSHEQVPLGGRAGRQFSPKFCIFYHEAGWTVSVLLGVPGSAELGSSDVRAACEVQQDTLETFKKDKKL